MSDASVFIALSTTHDGRITLRTAEINNADGPATVRTFAQEDTRDKEDGAAGRAAQRMRLQAEISTKYISIDDLFTQSFTDSESAGSVPNLMLEFKAGALDTTTKYVRTSQPHWHNRDHCEVCQRDFCVFRWRHHCRACGVSACARCCSKRLPLPSLMGHYLPVRVCNGCWQRTTRTWLQPPRALKNHDPPEVPYCCICMGEPSSAIFIPCG